MRKEEEKKDKKNGLSSLTPVKTKILFEKKLCVYNKQLLLFGYVSVKGFSCISKNVLYCPLVSTVDWWGLPSLKEENT